VNRYQEELSIELFLAVAFAGTSIFQSVASVLRRYRTIVTARMVKSGILKSSMASQNIMKETMGMKVMGMIQMKRVTTREMVMRTTKTAKSITANGVMETNQSRFNSFLIRICLRILQFQSCSSFPRPMAKSDKKWEVNSAADIR